MNPSARAHSAKTTAALAFRSFREGWRRALPFLALPGAAACAFVFAALALAGGPRGPSVAVRSAPERASVFVDGEFRGLTPLALRGLSAGPHAVRIEKAGFKPHFGTLGSAGASRALDVPLEPVPSGGIDVRTRPAGAEVFLDGEFRGVTPRVLREVRAGAHVLRIEKANCRPRTLTVFVTAGERLRARLDLEDRVLEYLARAAAESPDDLMCQMELGHYYVIAGEPKHAARAYGRALVLARKRGVDEGNRRKVEQHIGRDRQRGGDIGARMGAELDRIMRGPSVERRP